MYSNEISMQTLRVHACDLTRFLIYVVLVLNLESF